MSLIDAETFLDQVESSRILKIGGRLRSGKTALAHRLAYEFIVTRKQNNLRYLISNNASVWAERLEDIELRDGFYLDSVIIYDELGQFCENEWQAKRLRRFAGKLNNILIAPTVDSLPRSMQTLEVVRSFNFWRFGIPAWLYRWKYGKFNGSFLWLNPAEIFGIFDSREIVMTDKGVGKYLGELMDRLAGRIDNENEDIQNKTMGREGEGVIDRAEFERVKDDIEALCNRNSTT